MAAVCAGIGVGIYEAIAVRSFGAALAASLAGALVTLSLYRVAWKHAGKGMPARTTLLALVLAVLGLLGTPVVWFVLRS